MNTRLQVEHPVTEETTGADLVALQIDVADGARLAAQPPAASGYSIEARLYAEDPANNWQPQAGTLHRFRVPGTHTAFTTLGRTGVRLDSGVRDGSVVSVFYDPMLAKVISLADTRERAAAVLADALARAQIHGVGTNRDLLVNVLRHPEFRSGRTDTAFLDTHGLTALPVTDAALPAVAAALADSAHNRSGAAAFAAIPSGWRNLASGHQSRCYRDPSGTEIPVRYRIGRDGVDLPGYGSVTVVAISPDAVVLSVGGAEQCYAVARYGDEVFVDSPSGSVRLVAVPRFPDPDAAVAHGSLLAPMPGSVVRVGAAAGDRVTKGQALIWLEAMKMEHTIAAPGDGVLAELNVQAGQQVDVGAVLARIDTPEGEQP